MWVVVFVHDHHMHARSRMGGKKLFYSLFIQQFYRPGRARVYIVRIGSAEPNNLVQTLYIFQETYWNVYTLVLNAIS